MADGTYDDGGPGVGGPGPAAGATADAGSASGAWARAVHARQHYELVDWRRADNELNYRRFFAVNTLAGIRVEVPWVFDESHARILRWVRQGWVDGLRVDHPDGLADPAGYLQRLKEASGGVYVLVEKILEPGELLPADFRCEGTTGYDALAERGPALRGPGRRATARRRWTPNCAAAPIATTRTWSTAPSGRWPTACSTPRSAGWPGWFRQVRLRNRTRW